MLRADDARTNVTSGVHGRIERCRLLNWRQLRRMVMEFDNGVEPTGYPPRPKAAQPKSGASSRPPRTLLTSTKTSMRALRGAARSNGSGEGFGWEDGSIQNFTGWRVPHNNAGGPFKGGIRFHPSVSLDKLRAFAALMTWKNRPFRRPLRRAEGRRRRGSMVALGPRAGEFAARLLCSGSGDAGGGF